MHGVRPFADTDGENGLHAGVPGAGEQRVAVFGVARAVEMGVGVDHYLKPLILLQPCADLDVFEKTGEDRLAGLPSEAATIMPFDSRPRSLRGARLATMTTLRPTSDSGV